MVVNEIDDQDRIRFLRENTTSYRRRTINGRVSMIIYPQHLHTCRTCPCGQILVRVCSRHRLIVLIVCGY
jgi:hypothetical protein